MRIPKYHEIMLPLLKLASDNKNYSLSDAIEILVTDFNLTNDDKRELLPSGKQYKFNNRVGWARTYLKKAGLIESPERGLFKITEKGHQVLSQKPKIIDKNLLMKYPNFQEFQSRKKDTSDVEVNDKDNTPEEIIDSTFQEIKESLASELLENIKSTTDSYFEKIVVKLLIKMGYGGSIIDAGKAIGKSGDGGIDGIIKEDKLGLDVIYIQAKKWSDTHVGRPEIQKFAGSLDMHHANKGVFLTTSKFTSDAKDFVNKIQKKIILIDGNKLAHYMIDYNLGVSNIAEYELKKIDTDYFIDD